MSERRFEALTAKTMTDEQRRIVDDIAAGPRAANAALLLGPGGEIKGPFNALLRSPALGDRVQKFGEAVRFHSVLPKTSTEMAILLTARRWTAQFEWYVHERIALEAGLAPSIVAAIAAGERPSGLDPELTVVHDFVTELLATGEVSDASFAAVEDAAGERGVVDLVCLVGYYCLVSFLLNVERHPLPDGAPPALEPLPVSG